MLENYLKRHKKLLNNNSFQPLSIDLYIFPIYVKLRKNLYHAIGTKDGFRNINNIRYIARLTKNVYSFLFEFLFFPKKKSLHLMYL